MFDSKTQVHIGHIYCIENMINHKKYIGQTRKEITERFYEHKWDSMHKQEDNMALHRAIAKYGTDNFIINEIAKIYADNIEELDKKLDDMEIYYISELGTMVPSGYNVTRGGNTRSPSSEKPVYCYTKNGDYVCRFNSMNDAERITGISHSHISTASGSKYENRQCAGGYMWSTVPIAPSYQKKGANRKVAVAQMTMDGDIVRVFDSGADAARELNLQNTLISACCNGRRKSTGGYRWSFI